MAVKRKQRTLIAIGGHEDKERDRLILRCVAEMLPRNKLVVATLASNPRTKTGSNIEGSSRSWASPTWST